MDKEIKIGILGAGVTGLSVARFLQRYFDVEVLERNNVCGGIARTRDVNGIAYHTVGGHCFNSKYPEILDFVFNEVLPENHWNRIRRLSKIRLDGHEYTYPIEFSIKEIYEHDPQLAIRMSTDFLAAVDDGVYANLADWFCKKFGETLALQYFIPYNTKIWNLAPSKMDSSWVEDKLPIPDKISFFESLISDKTDNMPHVFFYYPKSNNQNTFLDALSRNVSIKYNQEVRTIEYDVRRRKWIINNIFEYDLLINTTPLDRFPALLEKAPDKVRDAAKLLRYNKVSNILWKTLPTNKTWTYFPESGFKFHRYIHIGSYFSPTVPCSISEAIGEHTFEELKENGRTDHFLLSPLAYNQSEHAYVVFDKNYKYAVPYILEYLSKIGIYSIGRFGEWKYYNMDVCMKRSMELANEIKQKYAN
ncbi:MAG: protoporphyrinogen/coproporphyrinogen oxidase [Lachnospiraceae bacterium]